VTAGSDTTSILTRSVFYQLLKHPDKLQRLMDELDQADREGRLSEYVSWQEAQQLPYLDAVIKEAGRLHPPFGLHLERHVPPEGAVICGAHLPGGTIVGTNSWAIHRREDPFGKDADEFRPERWLCDEVQRQKLGRALLTVSESLAVSVCSAFAFNRTKSLIRPSLSSVRCRSSCLPG
jgi:cytochrome P450